MAHVSRPLLIVLAATVALMAVWAVALRPKPVAVENTPLASTEAIARATRAAAVSDAANAKLQAAAADADGSAAAAQPAADPPATPSGAQQAATPKAGTPVAKAREREAGGARRNAQIERAVARGKVVVLLFWNPKASDDIATRGALRDLDLRGGKVVVRVVPISDVASYTTVTRGVKIAQSPTTVIIGRQGHSRVIAGLSEPREIAQAVGDALAGR